MHGVEFGKRQPRQLALSFLATRAVVNSFPSVVVPARRGRCVIIRRPWPTRIDAGVMRPPSGYATPLGTARVITKVAFGFLYSWAALRRIRTTTIRTTTIRSGT
jgi:hypothetical protein